MKYDLIHHLTDVLHSLFSVLKRLEVFDIVGSEMIPLHHTENLLNQVKNINLSMLDLTATYTIMFR